MPEQPHKQVKLGTLEYSVINQAMHMPNISTHAGSAPPSCFGTGHVTVLSTPPWKTEYSGVRQHRCSSTLDFFSACSEWKDEREQLNQVCP